jgi:glycosyltransferase involved in cell wall biosynthesis
MHQALAVVRKSDGADLILKSQSHLSVAIYIHDFSPGGVERQSLVLARELQARGVGVTLVVHQRRGELVSLIPDDLTVFVLGGKRTLSDVIDLRRFLQTHQPHVLMANVDHNNIAAAMAKAASGTSTRLVICQHNPLTAGFHATVNWKHRLVPFAYRMFASRIDHAVAVSSGIAAELVNHGGIPEDRVSTIFNAVIGSDFAVRAGAPMEPSIAPSWFENRDRPVFVTAGRLVEMKDHRTLLRAFAAFLTKRPGRLVLMGAGLLQPILEDLAQSLGIAEHVCFAGFVKNPLPYMRQADAFVLSSRSEGFGNVLVEAMGCGTPVVATDCPHGPADILEGGRYGLLVPPRDYQALARGMSDLLDQRDRFPEARLRARADMFSYGACADAYERLFRLLAV